MEIICPKCNSDNAKKLSLIYKENTIHTTSNIKTTTKGSISPSLFQLRFSDTDETERSTRSRSSSQVSETSVAAIAKDAAPPKKADPMIVVIVKTILVFLVLFIILLTVSGALSSYNSNLLIGFLSLAFSWVGLLGVPWISYLYFKEKIKYRRLYPKLYRKWDNSFMCQRCETIYEIADVGE